MSETLLKPAEHKQLFIDDHAIHSSSGVSRRLGRLEKLGPVLRPDRSWGQIGLQSRSSPQWNPEKGLWEWWHNGVYSFIGRSSKLSCYATSRDGVEWEAPSLGLFEVNGSRDNNVAGDPNGRRLYHVLRDEREEDPARRYKGLFDSHDRWLGVSPDGFDWTMLDVSPIPSQDESHFIYDEYTQQFLAFVKQATQWGRSVYLSTSTDFERFSFPRLVFNTDEIDNRNRVERIQRAVDDPDCLTPPVIAPPEYSVAQCYQMAVMPYEGLYVAFPVLFNPAGALPPPRGNHNGVNQTELAVSRDLRDWKRVANRDLFLGVLPWDGEVYDTAQILTCGRPVVREDLGEIWVYYNACRFRCHRKDRDESFDKYFDDLSALSLAKIRLDGFVSLDADTKGTLVTAPFALDRGGLYVNVDARRGELRAEVVDAETFDAVPGLSLSDCDAVRVDDLAHQLTWRERGAPARERPMRLRFELSQARLYAFWMGPRP
jgi:hypothetical protein